MVFSLCLRDLAVILCTISVRADVHTFADRRFAPKSWTALKKVFVRVGDKPARITVDNLYFLPDDEHAQVTRQGNVSIAIFPVNQNVSETLFCHSTNRNSSEPMWGRTESSNGINMSMTKSVAVKLVESFELAINQTGFYALYFVGCSSGNVTASFSLSSNEFVTPKEGWWKIFAAWAVFYLPVSVLSTLNFLKSSGNPLGRSKAPYEVMCAVGLNWAAVIAGLWSSIREEQEDLPADGMYICFMATSIASVMVSFLALSCEGDGSCSFFFLGFLIWISSSFSFQAAFSGLHGDWESVRGGGSFEKSVARWGPPAVCLAISLVSSVFAQVWRRRKTKRKCTWNDPWFWKVLLSKITHAVLVMCSCFAMASRFTNGNPASWTYISYSEPVLLQLSQTVGLLALICFTMDSEFEAAERGYEAVQSCALEIESCETVPDAISEQEIGSIVYGAAE